MVKTIKFGEKEISEIASGNLSEETKKKLKKLERCLKEAQLKGKKLCKKAEQ